MEKQYTLDEMITAMGKIEDEVRTGSWRAGKAVTHVNLPVNVVPQIKDFLEALREYTKGGTKL